MSLLTLGVSRPEYVGVIDAVGVSAAAAYGLRKLRAGYTGSAIRVRESGANAETDIGFTSTGDLDTTALLAFCGLWDGFIVTWYDQSGNGRNVIQSTALNQPRIVNSSTVSTINSRPALFLDGAQKRLELTTTLNFYVANAVHNPDTTTGGTRSILEQTGTTSGPRWYIRHSSGTTPATLKDATIATGGTVTLAPQVTTGVRSNGANSAIIVNGTTLGTSTVMNTTATVGLFMVGTSPLGGNHYSGRIGEAIVFESDLTTTQRQTMERNQGAYFGITVA